MEIQPFACPTYMYSAPTMCQAMCLALGRRSNDDLVSNLPDNHLEPSSVPVEEWGIGLLTTSPFCLEKSLSWAWRQWSHDSCFLGDPPLQAILNGKAGFCSVDPQVAFWMVLGPRKMERRKHWFAMHCAWRFYIHKHIYCCGQNILSIPRGLPIANGYVSSWVSLIFILSSCFNVFIWSKLTFPLEYGVW